MLQHPYFNQIEQTWEQLQHEHKESIQQHQDNRRKPANKNLRESADVKIKRLRHEQIDAFRNSIKTKPS